MEIRAALVWALLQLSLYCKNRGRRWRYTTAVGSSSGHLADNHDCQPNRTVSIRKYPTIPDMEASSPWGSVKVSGKVQLLLVWSSSWWSCGRAPLQTDSTPGGSTGVLTSGSLKRQQVLQVWHTTSVSLPMTPLLVTALWIMLEWVLALCSPDRSLVRQQQVWKRCFWASETKSSLSEHHLYSH